MTPPAGDREPLEAEKPELSRAVADYRERKEGLRAGSLAARIVLVGSLGWLVVLPALFGTWAGWRLDRHFESGVLWTAAGVMGGVSCGFYLLWRSLPGHGGD